MIATAITTPKRYSFEEYCQYDDGTDTRYELDNGFLQAMTPPSFRHILLAEQLSELLKQEITRLNLPLYCLREIGVAIGWNKSRIADLLVIPKDRVMENLEQTGIYQSSPNVIVEIVSPDSIKRDYRYKRSEYAAIGVPEYWIIDPLEAKVTLLIFNEGLYDETVFTGDRPIISPQFPDLQITAQTLLNIDSNP